jgi:hypothetical protein
MEHIMKKYLILFLTVSACLAASILYAASGERWEVITKTDMPGMPAGMGETTISVCMQKGAEKDPKQLMKQAGDCEVSELKTVGSKTTWKMRCDKDGNIMTGKGEVVYKTGSFQGVTTLSGMSEGEAVNMTAQYQGKRIGSPCDTSEAPAVAVKGMENLNEMMGMASKQMSSAMAEQCEVSNYRDIELISNRFFGPAAACPGKEKFACKVINKSVSKNAAVYVKLAKHDDTSDISIAKACGINMEATTKSICKIVDGNNYQDLAEYCPSEAKTFEVERTQPAGSNSGTSDSSSSSVIDGAKKLKGLFGF